jgi:hypothetical protein
MKVWAACVVAALGAASPAQQAAAATPGMAPAGERFEGLLGRPADDRPKYAWQRVKSGRVAFVSSLCVPGLGQLYNEREMWALVAAGVEFYFLGDLVAEQRTTNRLREQVHADPSNEAALVQFKVHRDNRIQATWLLGLSALLSGLHAYVDAHLFDFDRSEPLQLRAVSGGPGAALAWQF